MTAIKSPIGTAKWIDLQEPKRFNDADEFGSYSVTLLVDPEDSKIQEWMESMERTAEKVFAELEAERGGGLRKDEDSFLPWEDDTDREGAKTGLLAIKFRRKGGWKTRDGEKKTRRIAMVDHNAEPFQADGSLGWGTKLRVGFNMNAWTYPGKKDVSVSFQLENAQIIKPEYRGGGGGADFDAVDPEEFE